MKVWILFDYVDYQETGRVDEVFSTEEGARARLLELQRQMEAQGILTELVDNDFYDMDDEERMYGYEGVDVNLC